MKVWCKLHSMENDEHLHSQQLVECDLIKREGNKCIVRTPDKITCTAIYNPFSNTFYADDKYGVIKSHKSEIER